MLKLATLLTTVRLTLLMTSKRATKGKKTTTAVNRVGLTVSPTALALVSLSIYEYNIADANQYLGRLLPGVVPSCCLFRSLVLLSNHVRIFYLFLSTAALPPTPTFRCFQIC